MQVSGDPLTESEFAAAGIAHNVATSTELSAVASAVRRVDVRTGIQKPRCDRRIAVFGGDVDRGDAERVGGANVRTCLEQLVNSGQVVGPDGEMERGCSIRVDGVHVHALAQQQTDRGRVAARCRLNKTLIGIRRTWLCQHSDQRQPSHYV